MILTNRIFTNRVSSESVSPQYFGSGKQPTFTYFSPV